MKVATNVPFLFAQSAECSFVHLHDQHHDATVVVVMLPRNWGASTIQQIRDVTASIQAYPERTPCYIAGCETAMPDTNFPKYFHKERDDAIVSLCKLVLGRSGTIGVRGEITHRYLIEVLGLDADRVRLIYEKSATDNAEKISDFLHRSGLSEPLFAKEILRFQDEPTLSVYAKKPTFQQDIVIDRPRVEYSGGNARVVADIHIDGEVTQLWCEVDNKFAHYLLWERSDAFVCAMLPYAMRSGHDLVCHGPVSDSFLSKLNELLIPQLSTHDTRLYCSKIIAPPEPVVAAVGRAIATGMSCGVDSLYTALACSETGVPSMDLTHLYCGNYLYGNDSLVYKRAQAVSEEIGLPLVSTKTNINDAVKLPHLYTHFYKTMFGVLSLKKLFKAYYYSSAEDFSNFQLRDNSTNDTTSVELMLLYCFSGPDFQLLSGGGRANRHEKTRRLCNYKPAHNHLNVCLYPELEQNCGNCAKCMRTLVSIDAEGALARFGKVFDLDRYRANRVDAFVFLIQNRKSPYLPGVYEHFLKTEPDLMGAAMKKLSHST